MSIIYIGQGCGVGVTCEIQLSALASYIEFILFLTVNQFT